MRMMKVATVVAVAVCLAGCDQWMARTGFKPMTTNLPCGQKLENATWKGKESLELWTLTRTFRTGEAPETHVFKASTLFGVWEGQVTFVETFCK